jgi:hypothetical protein
MEKMVKRAQQNLKEAQDRQKSDAGASPTQQAS